MASKQRARAPKKGHKPNQLAGLGLFDIPDLDAMGLTDTVGDESDIDDSDLESELEAILSGKTESKKKPAPAQHKKKVVAPLDVTKLASGMDSLSLNFDEEPEEEEDDEKILNDPELLNELKAITCSEEKECEGDEEKELEGENPETESSEMSPKKEDSSSILPLLNERLFLYNEALASAKTLGDNTKVRRFARGIKSLENMIKSSEAGKHVSIEDVPPPVSIQKKPSSSVPTLSEASRVSTANLIENLVAVEEKEAAPSIEPDDVKHLENVLNSRRQKYKIAALAAKKNGDKATALEYMKIIKKFDALIQNSDDTSILSMLPPSPPPVEHKVSSHVPSAKEHCEIETSSLEAAALSAASEPEDPTLFDAPSAPHSILEALTQRLEKFSSTLSVAKNDGNLSKVRRLERIVKSYKDSIAQYKANKPVNLEELPVPPGFAPISTVATPPQEETRVYPSSKLEKPAKKNPGEVVPTRPPQRAPKVPSKNLEPPENKPKVHTQKASTLADKQLEFLLERQRLFREAAISAKKNGNTQQAMEYLRLSKGFTSMCEAIKCGLPVDMSSIPTPPQLAMSDSGFEIIDSFECDAQPDAFETFNLIFKDLNHQIEMSKNNKIHFFALGDVSSATKFEKLYLESQKDLSVVVNMKNLGQAPPKFHYETRVFSILQYNEDLTDDELAVSVERGINLPGKPDLDSFVRCEFPIHSDGAPQKAKTQVIRDTTNPSYQQELKFTFSRKSRTQQRQFKRQCLKLEVISKGGFLRSDSVLGTVSIPLVDFESKSTIHKSFDLMDGRKPAGGKLECKVRIRQPLVNKQIEQVHEKWLVIGS